MDHTVKVLPRNEVKMEDQWDLGVMYKDVASWEADFEKVATEIDQVEQFIGTLKDLVTIKTCLDFVMELGRKLEKLYVWASLKSSEDLSDQDSLKCLKRVELVWNDFTKATAFMEPELSKLDRTLLEGLVVASEMADYKMYLRAVIRNLDHILGEKEEQVLAHLQVLFNDPYQIFSTFDNVDANFGKIRVHQDQFVDLTHGNYSLLLENKNREIRERAFTQMYREYQEHVHTLAEVLASQIKQQQALAEIRGYRSALHRALHNVDVPEKLYTTLVTVVRDNLPVFHKYVEKRAELLGLDQMQMWDLRVHLQDVEFKFTYQEAVDLCVAAAAPLGAEYCEVLRKGLLYGWVDRYENVGKRSGAFSSGCYDSPPYILMNFKGTLNDVFTLMHEGGHSMHSFLASKNQPYTLADYPIFTAEIASTVNERLLMDHLLKTLTGEERKAVLHYELDAIRATFFRQTMFADFELTMHEVVAQKEPLTKDLLCTVYNELNKQYYGDAVAEDEFIQYEWARIPHFYYFFYVYQYSTGIAAAYYFAEQILAGKAETYLDLLRSGGSEYPLELITKAGLDMTNPDFYQYICKRFADLVEQM